MGGGRVRKKADSICWVQFIEWIQVYVYRMHRAFCIEMTDAHLI